MDSFVIFMFNNVKSVPKITFFQPNNVLFNAKNVIFAWSIPTPEAPMGRGWADIYTYKA